MRNLFTIAIICIAIVVPLLLGLIVARSTGDRDFFLLGIAVSYVFTFGTIILLTNSTKK